MDMFQGTALLSGYKQQPRTKWLENVVDFVRFLLHKVGNRPSFPKLPLLTENTTRGWGDFNFRAMYMPKKSQVFQVFFTGVEDSNLKARRMTRLSGSPFCNGRVTLLIGLTFLHINTMAHPAVSTQSRPDNQSMRQSFCHRQRGQLFASIDAR